MPNTFVGLEVPRGDGLGDPEDAGLTAATKTFIYPGAPAGRFAVEGSHDGRNFAVLQGRDRVQTLFSGTRSAVRTVEGVVKQLRVRALSTRGISCPAVIGLGALPAAGRNVFSGISVPNDPGLGETIDLGTSTGLLKTFILADGLLAGTRFNVLASVDGENFGEILRLQGGNPERTRTVSAICRFLRIERIGRGNCPEITVGAEGLAETGAGVTDDVGPPSSELTLSDERGAATTSPSEEQVLREYYVPLAGRSWPRGIEATFSAFCATDGDRDARALFNLRLGGRSGKPDGDVLVHVTAQGSGSPQAATSRSFSQPDDPTTLIKITGKGDGSARAALRSLVISFHGPE